MLVPTAALAWGFDGHRKLAQMMQDPLPANHCLRAWFLARQTSGLQDRACDPDRWRYPSAGASYDPGEPPRHYLEIDWVNPPADYPRDWNQALARLGNYAVRNGVVPWRVEEQFAALVQAFQANDAALILDRAFIFSHYVTDSFSLLHDTKNFDPNGLHQRWESDMLGTATRLNGVETTARGYFGTPGRADPKNNTFDVVLVGNAQVATLLAADQAATSTTAGAACTLDSNCAGGQYCIGGFCRAYDMTRFYNQVRDLTGRRFGDAATLLASMLWTAWALGGAPNLAGFGASCSKALPQGDPVLVGFPVPFIHPDGGVAAGGGAGGGAAGGGAGGQGGGDVDGGQGGGAGGGQGAGEEPPQGCGCASAPGALALAAAVLLALARRRRRP